MAVAAAIGVGSDDAQGSVSMGSNPMANRLNSKMKGQIHPGMGDINRSIEKMSIGSVGGGGGGAGSSARHHYGTGMTGGPAPTGLYGGPHHQQTNLQQSRRTATQPVATNGPRRDSNWTNSTEGYGSMRSEQSVQSSRRCSELSAMSQTSNVSTRAMMNSPTCWDPISVDHHSHNSRRSSLNQQMGAGGPTQQSNATMSHHLDRLRKKSHNIQQQQANCQQPQMQQQPAMGQNNSSGRMSAMSECSMPGSASQMPMNYGMPPPPQASSGGGGGGNQQHTVRRASDPVRALDRNFGVTGAPGASNGGHTQRRGSYNQMTNTQQQQQQQQQMQGGRMPLHGQKIRGTSGDFQGMQHMQPMNQVKILQDFKTDSV